jgi:hypothetical protein
MAATSYEDGQNLSSEKFARNHGTKHKNSTTVFQKERSIYRSQKTQEILFWHNSTEKHMHASQFAEA